MGYRRSPVAAAVAELLGGLDPTVAVFAEPPATFNPPVYIVGYTRHVDYDRLTFGVDRAELPVAVAVGVNEPDRLDDLVDAAKKALDVDPSCGGSVMHLRVTAQEQTRLWNVAGAEILAADLVLEIQQ